MLGYGFAGLCAGLALVVGLCARQWDFGSASDDLESAARDYRAAGLPWTAADLDRPVAKGNDASPLLRRAFDALPRTPRHLTIDASPTTLKRYAKALSIAHEAAKRPFAASEVDWDLGLRVKFRFAQSATADELSLAFAARAAQRAAQGDDLLALTDLEDARRIAALIGSEPSLMGVLSNASCMRAALAGAERCFKAIPDRRRKARYRTWLASPLPCPSFERAWRGEIYEAVATARNLSREQVAGFLLPGLGIDPWRAPSVKPIRRTGLPGETFARAFMARSLRMNAELARATHGLSDPTEQVTRAAETIRKRAAQTGGLSHNLDALLFPVFRLGSLQTRNEARRRALLLQAEG